MRYFATLGPACQNPETLKQMFDAGMTGIRLNLSHGNLADASEWIDHLVQAAMGRAFELLIDLNGPEVRVGDIAIPLSVEAGQEISLGDRGIAVPQEVLAVLQVGDYVLINDGRVRLNCLAVSQDHAVLKVLRGGEITSHKSLAIEGKTIPLPTLSQRDYENLAVMQQYPVTGVMLPFVRDHKDLDQLRAALHQSGLDHIRIYAKIENMAGIRHLPSLLPACDEIVIARGDLGNAMPLWELPAAQKEIAALCRQAGKPFIIATQLLDSMIQRAVPTRAEVCDIFNAVLDGAAGLMVTGETAVGLYPTEVMHYLVHTGTEAALWQQKQSVAIV